MPEYKKQHYLPSAYLKYFSIDQRVCNRHSKVWRLDRKAFRCVPVETQCSADYHYSKERAAETEKQFQINENAYCDCVDKIRSNSEPSGRNHGDLLLAMFDLHLRNAVHKNRTGLEGVDAYSRRVDIFLGQILLRNPEGEMTKESIINELVRNWRIEIVSAPTGYQFLTSDHPAVWTTVRAHVNEIGTHLHLVTLPITPEFMAIGFDRRLVRAFSGQASPNDVFMLNHGQAQHAGECVYMALQLPDKQLAALQKQMGLRSPLPCEIDSKSWKLALQYLPPSNHFSFLRMQPPLL